MEVAVPVNDSTPNKVVTTKDWIALFGGLLGAFMAILDIQITNSSLSEIQGALAATLDQSSWISTSYLVAEMIAIPLSAWFAKSLGERRYLVWTTAVFAISSFLCSLSWNLNSIIVFRAMQGFSGGALIPMAFTLITQILPLEKRATGMALFGITATFAPSIGPTLGGWLTQQFSWHYIFYINIPPAIAVIAMVAYGLRTKPIDFSSLKSGDWLGILTMAIGLGCLEVVLEQGNDDQWFSSSFIVTLSVISVISLVYFIIIELQHEKPLVNLRLLKDPQLAASCIAFLILGMAMYGSIYVIPLYLTQVQNYDSLQIGTVLMWMGFPQLLIFPILPKLTKYVKSTYLVAFGFVVFGISCYVNTHMTSDYAGPQLIVAMVLRAIGQPFIIVCISLLSLKNISVADSPDASSITNVSRNLGGAIGIAAISTLLQNRTTLHLDRIESTVSSTSPTGWDKLHQLQEYFVHAGSSVSTAALQAKAELLKIMQLNGTVMAYNDVFFVMFALLVFAAVLTLCMKD
ncbi:DHA2 family efflux MFS transporter permease subunit [Vibrio sp. S4M6]|uniref:DHA2 family efflux MFS transporter permease subunit n=1 Tax=Vibrio sinus TaxID=2946865 RepID=UPI00202A845A|nr:DHA2 family efflux MFS transporter permease subunit [Vibrio sinus]MCL9783975.1 DHA2 family efflux MFS transporter permease subunit [Vibrio sinus]